MHTLPLATIVWRWHRDPGPFERILRRVVDERIQLVTSGSSDWVVDSDLAQQVREQLAYHRAQGVRQRQSRRHLLMTTAVNISGFTPVLHSAYRGPNLA